MTLHCNSPKVNASKYKMIVFIETISTTLNPIMLHLLPSETSHTFYLILLLKTKRRWTNNNIPLKPKSNNILVNPSTENMMCSVLLRWNCALNNFLSMPSEQDITGNFFYFLFRKTRKLLGNFPQTNSSCYLHHRNPLPFTEMHIQKSYGMHTLSLPSVSAQGEITLILCQFIEEITTSAIFLETCFGIVVGEKCLWVATL